MEHNIHHFIPRCATHTSIRVHWSLVKGSHTSHFLFYYVDNSYSTSNTGCQNDW